MRPWRTLVWLLAASLLALALASERPVGPSPARADDFLVPQQVKDQVANSGQARVIVELRLPGTYVPEGDLPTLAHVAVQRANLASAQQQVSHGCRAGATRSCAVSNRSVLVLVVEPDALQELEASSFYVRRVIEDTLHQPMLAQSVPIVQGNQAWASGYDGTGTVIAIVDTGGDKTHPFLAGKVVEEACFSSTVPGKTSSICPNGQSQQFGSGAGVNCPSNILFCWHGTHVRASPPAMGPGRSVVLRRRQGRARPGGPGLFAWRQCDDLWHRHIAPVHHRLELRHPGRARLCLPSSQPAQFRGAQSERRSRHLRRGLRHRSRQAFIDNLRSVGIPTVIAAGNNAGVGLLGAPACVSSAVSVSSTEKTTPCHRFPTWRRTFRSSLRAAGSCRPAFPRRRTRPVPAGGRYRTGPPWPRRT